MSDCRPVKNPMSPWVANSFTIYDNQAAKSTVT